MMFKRQDVVYWMLAGMLVWCGCKGTMRKSSTPHAAPTKNTPAVAPAPSTASMPATAPPSPALSSTTAASPAVTPPTAAIQQVAYNQDPTLPAAPTEELRPPQANVPPTELEATTPNRSLFPPVKFDTTLPPSLWDRQQPGEQTLAQPLQLRQVTESVFYSFPALQIASLENDIAAGKYMSAWGEFDLKLKADSISQPLGYYKNYRNSLKLEQSLWQGGAAYGQYRIGSGSFQPWYGERETNEGGELKVGFAQPLLRDRNIDQRRADIMQASLRQQQVEPAVRAQLLEFVYDGADAYWSWVAAGQAYEVNRDLLRITIERNKIYEARVKVDDLPQVELVQNERLITLREAKLIESQRKLQQSAIKLSLFFRDEGGEPKIPPPSQLPRQFPEPVRPDVQRLDGDIATAFASRPELQELNFIRSQAEIDLSSGQNLTRPALNATVEAGKDVGQPTPKGDKTPFELEAGLFFEVPMQRRKGYGKIQEAQGKLGQVAAKRRFVENKIQLQMQDAMSALTASYDRWLRAKENVLLARQLEAAERERFARQDNDLLRVALQESAAIEAALQEIEALADYYKATAAYRAAMGAEPLETGADPVVPINPVPVNPVPGNVVPALPIPPP